MLNEVVAAIPVLKLLEIALYVYLLHPDIQGSSKLYARLTKDEATKDSIRALGGMLMAMGQAVAELASVESS